MACNSQHFSGEQKTVLTRYFYDQNVQSTRKEYLEIIGKIANEIGSTPDKVKVTLTLMFACTAAALSQCYHGSMVLSYTTNSY